ncbi:hypothetical protein MMC18_009489, partial [Xylographa bjoerkii]|nr:hypothetical protein [Xylographa bjoerkii]
LKSLSRSRKERQEVVAHTKEDVFWPEDLLSVNFPSARVMTYGYDSHISHFFNGPANQNNIMTHGEDLLHRLAGKRSDTYGRRIIFIVHSLGGIVLKEALRRSRGAMDQEVDLKDIYNSTFVVIFFGTPHRGSDYSNIGLAAVNAARAAGFDVNKQLLRTLAIDSEYLRLLREEFSKMLESRRWPVVSFQEAHGLKNIAGLHDKRRTIGKCAGFGGAKDPHYIQVQEVLVRYERDLNQTYSAQAKNSLWIPQIQLRPLDDMTDAYTETLHWLFRPSPTGPGFVEWLKGDECIYWIQGKPGSGTSTAMKHIFGSPNTLASLDDHDTKSQCGWVIIGSFFHDRRTQLQKSLDGILHSMLWQIIERFPDLVRVILKIEELQARLALSNTTPGTVEFLWTTANLKRALFCVLQQNLPRKVCFVVDALDEYEGNYAKMVVFLEKLVVERHPANVIKLCAASRPYNPFIDGFSGRPTLDMEEWTRGDIRRYVNGRLKSHYCVSDLLVNESSASTGGSQSQLESLIQQITDRASGVFLWVRLVVEQLLDELTAGANVPDLQRHLDRFPEDLDEFYRHLIATKVPKQDRFEAYVMLESVLCARGPLTLAQLDLILRLALGRLSIKDDHSRTAEWAKSTSPNMERRIVHCCRCLLEVQDGKFKCFIKQSKSILQKRMPLILYLKLDLMTKYRHW